MVSALIASSLLFTARNAYLKRDLLDLNDNEILCDYQFGFPSKHSTQQALITLVDRVTKSFDRTNIVVSLFIDLKKAFDTDHHGYYSVSYMHTASEVSC